MPTLKSFTFNITTWKGARRLPSQNCIGLESIKNLFLHKTSSWIRKICSPGETMKTFFFFHSVNPHEKTHVRGLTSVPFLSSLRQMPYSSSVLQLKTKKSIKEINKVLYTACIKNGHFFLIRCLCQYFNFSIRGFMILLSSRPGLKAANWLRGWHS